MPSRPFDAVVLIAFGGPQGPDDVRPFLANVLRGRRVSPQRIEEVARHYDLFGGVSPLTELTRRQAAGLRKRIADDGLRLPVYTGMRNWRPFLADTLAEMSSAGVRRAIGFIMAPHRSYSSCGQYRQNVADATERIVSQAQGEHPIEVTYVGDWHAHPLFIEANAQRIREAITRLPANLPRRRLVFTAHSLPEAMPGADVYCRQLGESAWLAAAAAGVADWAVAFQSRSGRPEDAWLSPDICDYLHAHRAEVDAVVLSPIGFVSDHIEVLYDLDREAMGVCQTLSLPAERAATVNDDPIFVEMMANVIRETVDRYAGGRPVPIAASNSAASGAS